MIRIGLLLKTSNGYVLETIGPEPNSYVAETGHDLMVAVQLAEEAILRQVNPPVAGPADTQPDGLSLPPVDTDLLKETY